MRNYPVQLLNADNSTSRTGSAFFVGQAVAGSITVVNGDVSAAGTLKVQYSNEIPSPGIAPEQYVPTAASFCDVTGATSAVSAGVGPAIVLATMNAQYIRVVYTSSGAGNTTIKANASFLGV